MLCIVCVEYIHTFPDDGIHSLGLSLGACRGCLVVVCRKKPSSASSASGFEVTSLETPTIDLCFTVDYPCYFMLFCIVLIYFAEFIPWAANKSGGYNNQHGLASGLLHWVLFAIDT